MISPFLGFSSSSSGCRLPQSSAGRSDTQGVTAPLGVACGFAYCVGSSSVTAGEGGCLQSWYVGECMEQADGRAAAAAAIGVHVDGAVRGGDDSRRRSACAGFSQSADLDGYGRGLRDPDGASAVT